jgi:hypothetical protein
MYRVDIDIVRSFFHIGLVLSDDRCSVVLESNLFACVESLVFLVVCIAVKSTFRPLTWAQCQKRYSPYGYEEDAVESLVLCSLADVRLTVLGPMH